MCFQLSDTTKSEVAIQNVVFLFRLLRAAIIQLNALMELIASIILYKEMCQDAEAGKAKQSWPVVEFAILFG